MKKLWFLLLIPVIAAAVWFFQRKPNAPKVTFAKASRQTISSTLSTNGKVEPLNYVDVRAEVSGLVARLLVHQGDAVRAGQAIAELSQPGSSEELQAAEARASQASAELSTLRAGGRGSDLAEIEGNSNRLKAQRAAAQRNVESLQRLVAQNAATRFELDQARQAVSDLDVQIQSLSQRQTSLVGRGDLSAAQARLREAEVSVQLARTHIGQNTIHTPIGGVVYDLPVRQGAYLNPGDPVGSVGILDPVRVRVYVDEPELGRVATGQAVRITWDALPGKEWSGVVEKKPTEVVALGSRQVGEVLCTISNPSRELVPGTNVNAFILTQVVHDALTIPKASVRRDNGLGVYLLQPDNSVKWQPVKTGVSDALRVEITSGLKDGDQVTASQPQ